MIIDGHAHVFSSKIIANVSAKPALVKKLDLQSLLARRRSGILSLNKECLSSGVDACLILPTAAAADVTKTNRSFMGMAAESDFIFTAGTLHPFYHANREELAGLRAQGIRAIKLCSFSQGFSLESPETFELFKLVEEINSAGKNNFFVILDTFYFAHEFFGTPARHTTTPALLGELVRSYREVNFVAAHMGGLAAPPGEIFEHLVPSENLYLDTSNAAHTLSEGDFLHLLELHGPGHIIFGTDWPWFGHQDELERIDKLLDRAKFNGQEKEMVFYRNIAGLLGIL
jgi:uncharacterized protein